MRRPCLSGIETMPRRAVATQVSTENAVTTLAVTTLVTTVWAVRTLVAIGQCEPRRARRPSRLCGWFAAVGSRSGSHGKRPCRLRTKRGPVATGSAPRSPASQAERLVATREVATQVATETAHLTGLAPVTTCSVTTQTGSFFPLLKSVERERNAGSVNRTGSPDAFPATQTGGAHGKKAGLRRAHRSRSVDVQTADNPALSA
ncbi:hypothetical protein OKW27_006732 [Paraburkholderia sp. 35.1]